LLGAWSGSGTSSAHAAGRDLLGRLPGLVAFCRDEPRLHQSHCDGGDFHRAGDRIFNDKLPKTPARTAIPSLITRILSGACSAAALAVSTGSGLIGAIIAGSLGAVLGTYGGYNIRHSLVIKSNLPDFAVAFVEDVIAIVGALLVVSRL